MRCFMRLAVSLTLAAWALLGADPTGEWKATADGPNGAMTRTFSFKADGAKLTGETVSSVVGKSTITDGKIDGDRMSFTIDVKFQDNEMKVRYDGKIISKDEIRFTADVGGNTIEWVAKRVP